MRFFLFSLLWMAPAVLFAQGIHFETGNWQSVVAKAKKEKKLIYVDVYTTWCGPCKMLEANIFPKKEAGDKYNALFVNYRLDAEKGAGIPFAKKYEVNGYPTNLFLDPNTGKVIYRVSGAPVKVEHFNDNADIAIAERNDPMTPDKYKAEFASGNHKPEFLKKYLLKLQRLEQKIDEVLNAYVATLDTKNLSDSDVYFLAEHTHSLFNDAVPLLDANRDVMDAQYPENTYSTFDARLKGWAYGSYEIARNAKDEKKLNELDVLLHRYQPKEATSEMFWYRNRFYLETGDTAKAEEVAQAEADYLSGFSLADFAEKDRQEMEKIRVNVRHQLSRMKLPEGANIDTLVERNLGGNLIGLPSLSAANTLNDLAWKVFENKKATKAQLTQAIQWSRKAVEFSKPYPAFWASYADTYASLLYRSGQKEEAIKIEQAAWETAKSLDGEDAANLEETLKKMKDGTF